MRSTSMMRIPTRSLAERVAMAQPMIFHSTESASLAALMMACAMVGNSDDTILAELRASLAAASSTTSETWSARMFGSVHVERSPGGVFLRNIGRELSPPPTNVGGYDVEDGAVTNEQMAILTMPSRSSPVPRTCSSHRR
ncbi:MAG: hypothetical protein OXI41_14350 [Chloroflexota bacterium]|nr:hypothetical protein [Chloroflexota bacterium]MDE2895776.1 hypothetical protein [Chloroflexota bacterium]